MARSTSATANRIDRSASRTRIGLVLTMVGSVMVLMQPNFTVGIVGVAIVAAGLAIAWPTPEHAGIWWLVVLVGGLFCVFSPLVARPAEVLGGWMGAIGTVLVLSGAIVGFPKTSRSK